MQQPFYIVFVAVYFLQQSKHAGQMLRVDVIKQQHHHGETHGKGAGVLKIRLQKFPHRLRMRAGQLQSAAKAVAHRPIIYFRHESSGAGQNLLRRRADSTNDHSLQHDFFKRAVSCGIQIGGPIPLGNAARKAAQQGKAHAQHVFRAGQKPAGKTAYSGSARRTSSAFMSISTQITPVHSTKIRRDMLQYVQRRATRARDRSTQRRAAQGDGGKDDGMLKIGSHISSSKGYAAMGRQARKLGANTFAFFTRNPRGGSVKALDEADVAEFLDKAAENGVEGPIVAHAPYTMNACAADPGLREFAQNMMRDDLARLEHTPGNYYNFIRAAMYSRVCRRAWRSLRHSSTACCCPGSAPWCCWRPWRARAAR